MREAPKVGSRFQIGQTVIANFKAAGKLFPCVVTAILFTDRGKVLYDLSVIPYPIESHISEDEDGNEKIRYYLRGVDSCALEDPADDIIDNILTNKI